MKRKIKVDDSYDVVICGGGMAGASAAIIAGRLGARVLLVESLGCLGGMATSGLVPGFDGTADGEKMIAGGIFREIVETLYRRGDFPEHVEPDYWQRRLHRPIAIKPEPVKRLLDELTLDANVEIRYFAKLIEVDSDLSDKKVNGVIVSQIDGLKYIPAKCFIDCTGDAILSTLAGADYFQALRDTENVMPPTLTSLWAGIEWGKGHAKSYLKKAVQDGHFSYPDAVQYSLFIMSKTGHHMGGLNAGHIFGTDPLDTASLTNAMIVGRKMAGEYESFLRKYVPGYENVDLSTTGTLLGVRESRRVLGEYFLTFDDFKARKKFHDQICIHNKEIDIHNYEPTKEAYEDHRKQQRGEGWTDVGETYGIPYGVIVAKGWKNLWMAGRCVSTDVFVHGSSRVMPSSSHMGMAAGTAAVLTIQTGKEAKTISMKKLINTLRDYGAYLPQEETYETLTTS